MSNKSRLKPASDIDQTGLKSVAGMLRRTVEEKLADAEIEKRIGAQLLAEDNAVKSNNHGQTAD
jgi:hypothetical protein